MCPSIPPARTFSLASIHPGDVVRIVDILFDVLRSHCHDLGLSEQVPLKCRTAGGAWLQLEGPEGRTVLLERDWARFIEVAKVADAIDPGAPGSQRPDQTRRDDRPRW
jgi:hypothetical protein